MVTPSEIKAQADKEAKEEAKQEAVRRKKAIAQAKRQAKKDSKSIFKDLEKCFTKEAQKRNTEYDKSFSHDSRYAGREYLQTLLDELTKLCADINVKLEYNNISYNTSTEYEGLMDPCPVSWTFINYSVYVKFTWK